jgi:hypothetical protein
MRFDLCGGSGWHVAGEGLFGVWFEGRQNFMIHYRRRGRLRSTSVLKNVLVQHGRGQGVRVLPLILTPSSASLRVARTSVRRTGLNRLARVDRRAAGEGEGACAPRFVE